MALADTVQSRWDKQYEALKKYQPADGNLSASGELRTNLASQDKLKSQLDAEQMSASNIGTNKELSNMFGGRGYESGILDRGANSDMAQANQDISNRFERMFSDISSSDSALQDNQAYEADKMRAGLDYQKGRADNAMRLAQAQAESQKRGPFGAILGVGGAVAGGILGGPAGAAAGFQVGNGLGNLV